MLILGIESSCDETAAAVVRDGREVLSSVIHSQIEAHRPYGGVVPEIASRAHVEHFPVVVKEALVQARVSWRDIDGIAVTHGPGLVSSLLIGLSGARALGQVLNKPVWGIHHLEAHMMAAFLDSDIPPPETLCPLVMLLVSGGHTMLIEMQGIGKYRILGQTLDDAAGECLDKGANLLGLSYPGGPIIEKVARTGNPHYIDFPRGMLHAPRRVLENGMDTSMCFSFSGLKTALLYHLKKHPEDKIDHLPDVAASYQEAVMDALARRVARAMDATRLKTLACVGGVAKNAVLRAKLADVASRRKLDVYFAPLAYCTDNAAMIAALAGLRHAAGLPNPPAREADPSLPLVEDK